MQVRVTGETGASASVSEYPEGFEGVNDLWAVPAKPEYAPVYGNDVDPNVPLADINGRLSPFHALQVADFVQAVRLDTEPAVTGREALKSLQIVTAIYQSSRTGQPVRFPAPAKAEQF